MENSGDGSSSQPAIGFPLGLALLLLLLLCMSGFFCCCYYWDKLRSCLQSSSHDYTNDTPPHAALSPPQPINKEEKKNEESLTVLMPGDEIPRFVALPAPRGPPKLEKISVALHMQL
ncbi:unnamed protein product [Ilex paraguariensis]|uniref:Hydroxyproline-rich glycoprotein family protein n=1 Tax=Ilex paraguariensis TaxID=185542 RepID=A0ABC8SL42_9AQUA